MGDFLDKGVTFQSGSQVTHTDLNDLVDNAVIKDKAISYNHLRDGSIADSVMGFPILVFADISNQDYFLTWSATHNEFRKVQKEDFVNTITQNGLTINGVKVVDEEGLVLASLSQPDANQVLFNGKEFRIQANEEERDGTLKIIGRLDAPDGVSIYNVWDIISKYSANTLVISPDSDNAGGTPLVEIGASVKADNYLKADGTDLIPAKWSISQISLFTESIVSISQPLINASQASVLVSLASTRAELIQSINNINSSAPNYTGFSVGDSVWVGTTEKTISSANGYLLTFTDGTSVDTTSTSVGINPPNTTNFSVGEVVYDGGVEKTIQSIVGSVVTFLDGTTTDTTSNTDLTTTPPNNTTFSVGDKVWLGSVEKTISSIAGTTLTFEDNTTADFSNVTTSEPNNTAYNVGETVYYNGVQFTISAITGSSITLSNGTIVQGSDTSLSATKSFLGGDTNKEIKAGDFIGFTQGGVSGQVQILTLTNSGVLTFTPAINGTTSTGFATNTTLTYLEPSTLTGISVGDILYVNGVEQTIGFINGNLITFGNGVELIGSDSSISNQANTTGYNVGDEIYIDGVQGEVTAVAGAIIHYTINQTPGNVDSDNPGNTTIAPTNSIALTIASNLSSEVFQIVYTSNATEITASVNSGSSASIPLDVTSVAVSRGNVVSESQQYQNRVINVTSDNGNVPVNASDYDNINGSVSVALSSSFTQQITYQMEVAWTPVNYTSGEFPDVHRIQPSGNWGSGDVLGGFFPDERFTGDANIKAFYNDTNTNQVFSPLAGRAFFKIKNGNETSQTTPIEERRYWVDEEFVNNTGGQYDDDDTRVTLSGDGKNVIASHIVKSPNTSGTYQYCAESMRITDGLRSEIKLPSADGTSTINTQFEMFCVNKNGRILFMVDRVGAFPNSSFRIVKFVKDPTTSEFTKDFEFTTTAGAGVISDQWHDLGATFGDGNTGHMCCNSYGDLVAVTSKFNGTLIFRATSSQFIFKQELFAKAYNPGGTIIIDQISDAGGTYGPRTAMSGDGNYLAFSVNESVGQTSAGESVKGKVYVYKRVNDVFTQFVCSIANPNDGDQSKRNEQFGQYLDFDYCGKRLVISSEIAEIDVGAWWLYDINQTSNVATKVFGKYGTYGDEGYGSAIRISGDGQYVLVGAAEYENAQGADYNGGRIELYKRSGGTSSSWTMTKLWTKRADAGNAWRGGQDWIVDLSENASTAMIYFPRATRTVAEAEAIRGDVFDTPDGNILVGHALCFHTGIPQITKHNASNSIGPGQAVILFDDSEYINFTLPWEN